MRKFWQILLAAFIVVGGCTLGPPSAAIATSGCSDVEFIFARGSGEPLGGPSQASWETALRRQLAGSSLKYSFYELGSESYHGAQYPAVAVSGSIGGISNLVGAFISAGESFAFARSVATGRSELRAHIKTINAICPQTKFVLGGYSQGAMLISGMLEKLPAEKIIYIATFGDPKLYLPEGKGNHPPACRGQNLSNYRTYVSDCHAYEGVLGSYRPYQPADFYNKLGTWCNHEDIMCSSGFDIDDHTKYTQLGLYNNAASIIYSKLEQTYPGKIAANPEIAQEISPHDLVIFWHAGIGGWNSTDVATYKMVAQRLINQTYSLGGRVAFYVYSESLHGARYQLCNFSCTADELNQKLSKITSLLTSGSHYNCPFSLMRQAFNELEWQVGATKSAVVLSPSTLDYYDHVNVTLEEIAQLSLEIDPINIYPIMSSSALKSGQALAAATNGKVYDVKDASLAVEEITQRPDAGIALEKYVGKVGEEFTFDATRNTNGQPLALARRYDWDLDADGVFELQDSTPVVRRSYAAPLEGYIQVRVTDADGRSSTMSARLSVTNTATTPPTITNLRVDEYPDLYRVRFITDATQVLVILNNAPMSVIQTNSFGTIFDVKDVNYRTHLRLIPYNKSGGRGEAAEVDFGPLVEYQFDYPDNDEGDVKSPTSGAASLSGSNTSTSGISNPSEDGHTKIIPTAPNTGVAPSRGN